MFMSEQDFKRFQEKLDLDAAYDNELCDRIEYLKEQLQVLISDKDESTVREVMDLLTYDYAYLDCLSDAKKLSGLAATDLIMNTDAWDDVCYKIRGWSYE